MKPISNQNKNNCKLLLICYILFGPILFTLIFTHFQKKKKKSLEKNKKVRKKVMESFRKSYRKFTINKKGYEKKV